MAVYSRILVPLEHSAYDAAILEHVRPLARLCGAAVLLIHVADGWAAVLPPPGWAPDKTAKLRPLLRADETT